MSVRILIADDEPQMHSAYRDCFALQSGGTDDVAELAASLFGDPGKGAEGPDFSDFRFDYVSQGEDAVRAVAQASAEGDPYAVLFLDMRMPPGIDGYETAKQVRELDKAIAIAVVTGYSDHEPTAIARVAGPLDKLFYIHKPFKAEEIQQLTLSLGARWNVDRELLHARTQLQVRIDQVEEANVELAASEARNRHLALHDQLTRLPNRTQFNDFLERLSQQENGEIATIFIDLDHFKNVNDTLGHAAGDELICEIALRLSDLLPDSGILARLGGDEFAVALHGVSEEDALALGDEIVAACGQAFEIMGTRIFVGASVGIAVTPAHEFRAYEALRRADLALYAAKNAGRNVARLFNHSLDESAQSRAKIEHRLRCALKEGKLRLGFQPIVWTDDGAAYGYEALLRWTDEELGEVPPGLFVPVAEECGLARELGEWVISNAIAECGKWQSGVISINISTLHFQTRGLVDFITGQAEAYGVDRSRIQFEITETAMFKNPDHAALIIRELRQAGIRIALDDFGTGYSSLVNVRDFELDCVKIDKSFVDTLGDDHQSAAIVSAVTAMARMLRLDVVAEGVETAEQVQALRLLGCGMMQGFYYAKAMKPEDLPFEIANLPLPDNEAIAGELRHGGSRAA